MKEATTWGLLANPDGDASANLVEFALATSPVSAAAAPIITTSLVENPPGGPRFLEATFRIREGTSGITVDAQTSGDLVAWQTQTPLSTISQGDNTAIVTVRDSEPQSAGTKRFFRVKVTSP